ncbi:hypothetical protein RDI58_007727 [Solanum bulbocastanum]|uniref:DUF4283 domain-containing protein n=1 Tax=Solanum bulbocastanum TaxID=147425 RepID=A0AAN8YHZ5_SOLBU
MKQVSYTNGVPRIQWTEEEVHRMNYIENLQYAVVGKFSYGWPDLEELRTIIPRQCNIIGECKIGLLRNRHVLIRLEQQEDFINLLETRDQAQEKEGDTEQSHGITNTSNNKQTESTKDWIKQAFGEQQNQIAIQHSTNSTTENSKCKTVDKDEQAVATEEVVNNKVGWYLPKMKILVRLTREGRMTVSINMKGISMTWN